MIYTDRARLGKTLVRIALSNRSRSSGAVYHAMTALASHHRGHSEIEVNQLKHAALQNLHPGDNLDMYDVVEHIAANLLLCIVEVCETHAGNPVLLIQYRCSRQLQETHVGSAISVV
jgi:hypothetical protein